MTNILPLLSDAWAANINCKSNEPCNGTSMDLREKTLYKDLQQMMRHMGVIILIKFMAVREMIDLKAARDPI